MTYFMNDAKDTFLKHPDTETDYLEKKTDTVFCEKNLDTRYNS